MEPDISSGRIKPDKADHSAMGAIKEIALLSVAILFAVLIAANRQIPIWYTLGIVLAGYLAWHFVQLLHLYFWVRQPKRFSPPAAVGIWHDIVLRLSSWRRRKNKRKRKLERMVDQAEQSYRAIADATIIVDKNSVVEWLNEAAMDFAHAPREDILGKPFEEAFAAQHDLVEYFNHDDYQEAIQIYTSIGQERTLEVRIFPYGDGKRLLNAHDISQIYHLQTVRQDFVANVSHEMRTPLTVLSGYLETMSDSESFDHSEWKPVIETMYTQTYRMQRIVDDLLVLARLENIEYEDEGEHKEMIDIQIILGPILIEARHLSGKARHDIQLQYEGDTHFYGQAKDMDVVMSNLVFNAVKYTPKGGLIQVNWVQNQSGAYFEVIDSGIGIPEQHLPRLTERFYRVDKGRSRDSGGTGLGLAIVKHALNRLGGELQIQSEPGEGSIFRCYFPNAPDESPD